MSVVTLITQDRQTEGQRRKTDVTILANDGVTFTGCMILSRPNNVYVFSFNKILQNTTVS